MVKPIDAGTLRHRIQIQTLAGTRDSFGQPNDTWTTAHECWANIDIVKGQLFYQTAEFVSQSTYRITIRYPKGVGISVRDRVLSLEDGQKYQIQSVLNPEQRNVYLELFCYLINPTE